MTELELLAPARDAETARQAILHGADAVYIGGPSHGARAAAANTIEDLRQIVSFAHQYGVKVYATFNTLILENELAMAEKAIGELYRIGIDALIAQDMGILRLDIPPIDLHASTQCDIRTPEKAKFLAEAGFSQLVLPRELSLQEIREMREAVPAGTRLEAFVHGALCVSYSGDCQASYTANGRSANRGACAQMCRMAYDLVDGEGNVLIKDKHLLSLRDLNRLGDIAALAQAGVTSFKIEGRLKDAGYVKETVGAYRRAIDELIAANPEKYRRASLGKSRLTFDPDVQKAFNRGFTSYFLRQPGKMANFDTPKSMGEKVGTVTRNNGKYLEARLTAELSNGDGLGYFDAEGKFNGFRVNRAEGNRIYVATPVDVQPRTTLYRNSDAKREALLAGDTARRVIPVDMQLRKTARGLALRIGFDDTYAEAAIDLAVEAARTPQSEIRRRALSKLGDTIFELSRLDDKLDEMAFVPLSALSALRRQAAEALTRTLQAAYKYAYRRPENMEAKYPSATLDYHGNVANSAAAEAYFSHGVEKITPALEAGKIPNLPTEAEKPHQVMETRYCLRRELGACLRTEGGKALPSMLYLQNRAAKYRLDFDCANCRMRVLLP